jgi:translation initiation factor 2 subunit 1
LIVPKNLPDVGEFVIIKITKIMPHGAYCKLSEYNLDSYLPISEVASGWIKNIHEFIKEGQQDVAKVIFVDREKGSVDISLKKATSKDKKDKINDYGLEKRAEGIFNKAIVMSKQESNKQAIASELGKHAKTYNELVNSIFEGTDPLANFKDKEFKQALYSVVAKTIKPKTYTVAYNVDLTTTDTKSGLNSIKEALLSIEKEGVDVLYMGAPRYRLLATDSSYLKAEDRIKNAQKILEKHKNLEFEMKSSKVPVA